MCICVRMLNMVKFCVNVCERVCVCVYWGTRRVVGIALCAHIEYGKVCVNVCERVFVCVLGDEEGGWNSIVNIICT